MLALWVIGILTVWVILHITYKQKFSKIGRMAAKLPGPKTMFLLGNVFEFSQKSGEFIYGILRLSTDYGNVCRMWLGPSLYVLISGYNDLEFFLSSNSILKKAKAYDFLDGWLGTGLLTADESAMGTPVNAQMNKQSEFAQALKCVTTAIMDRTFKPWLFPKVLFDLSPTGRLHNQNLKYILNFVDEVIIKKKNVYEETKMRRDNSEELSDEYGLRKKYAFLDLMLQYRDTGSGNLSDLDIREEVNTFMFAGHDTGTSAVSFMLYSLARHEDVQNQAVEELEEIFGDSDRDETFQDLQNMKYLERVIKESMRLYSTVPFIGRHLVEDVTLPSGYTLPKGASVTLFLHKLHHNPKYFPDPEKFNPDNFLLERMSNRPPFAYCPFSAGPRNCIGQKFAMLEMKSMLSSVLRKYRLLPSETGPEVVMSSELVLRSTTGMHIRIEKRN